MKIAEADILLVPGRTRTLGEHWQHRWQKKMANAEWVPTASWNNPDLSERAEELYNAIVMATRPVVLVAHSLGVVTTALAAQKLADTKVRGAFLVAPPDVDGSGELKSVDVPREPLPFPSLMVASTSDPYCTPEKAVDLGTAWGSDFHLAGDAGHIDTASGHGPWPEGLMMFTRLMQRLKA